MSSRFLGFKGISACALIIMMLLIHRHSKNKQDVAQSLSSRINEAYQRLLTPLSRAEYLLESHDHPISEADQVDNVEFMSEVMHVRETIEEADEEGVIQTVMDENQCSWPESYIYIFKLMNKEQPRSKKR